jgi:hypothetical protein
MMMIDEEGWRQMVMGFLQVGHDLKPRGTFAVLSDTALVP